LNKCEYTSEKPDSAGITWLWYEYHCIERRLAGGDLHLPRADYKLDNRVDNMSLYQSLYFMSLIGGISGLLSWAAVRLFEASMASLSSLWVSDLIATVALGALVGSLTVAFSDRHSGDRVTARSVASGTMVGILAGLVAGLLQIPIRNTLSANAPIATRIIAWMLAGSLIGLALGLRWMHLNRMRVVHAYIGGLLGGLLGGITFSVLGTRIPDLSQSLSFVVVGMCTCFGVAFAPILMREATLQFVSSGDPRAQMKFGRARKQWPLQHGDSYSIGSQSHDRDSTQYRPEIEVYIPDAAVAFRHAVLFSKDGRFFLARHSDLGGNAGMAKYVVRVRGKTVVSSQELFDSDDILIGRTALRFVSKRSSS
jgi:hypothetical protein